ncbi:hypothetical protein GCM10010946_35510 [Undibacterium squillarum]|uniref:Uncharacterized protein n=1 Tax=Undibacterium squillarum TaxID=1131567 RepID=A0ABQ2Y2U4_9BURK|nr:hypothetical protein GCM10010946_35510 [Undibacterium squillarum]
MIAVPHCAAIRIDAFWRAGLSAVERRVAVLNTAFDMFSVADLAYRHTFRKHVLFLQTDAITSIIVLFITLSLPANIIFK